MAIERIPDLEAFVAVVEQGGVSAAARRLGRSVQSVSRSLAAVERVVGAELVRRTTRNSHVTSAGTELYRRVSSALKEIACASAQAAGARDRAIGVLRVSASTRFGPAFVVPAAAAYLASNKEVEVELILQDDYVDLVGEGYDLAVRVGPMPDSSLKARRLASLRRVTFAAPQYIAARGRPSHPRELAHHSCILRTHSREGGAWTYIIDGALEAVRVNDRFRSNNVQAANQAVLEGIGIGNAPYWQVRESIASGAAELLLTDYEPPEVSVHAVWPNSVEVPAKTRLFIDHLAAHLKSQHV